MPRLLVELRDGTQMNIDCDAELSVMEALRAGGVDEVLALCGGGCACATCHVYIDPAFVGRVAPMDEDENDILDGSAHRGKNSRLSCQIPFGAALDGLRVVIAPED